MKLGSILLMVLFFSGCESGRVVELVFEAQTPTVSDTVLTNIFKNVSRHLDMDIRGPIRGPGSDVEYVAEPQNSSKVSGFFMFANFGERRSYVIRTLRNNVSRDWADVPLQMFEKELTDAGIKYRVRRN